MKAPKIQWRTFTVKLSAKYDWMVVVISSIPRRALYVERNDGEFGTIKDASKLSSSVRGGK